MNARGVLVRIAAALGTIGLCVLVTALAIDGHLKAGRDEWAMVVRIGPFERRWQVAATARLASHPGVARWLDGRTRVTSQGTWTLRRTAGGVLRASCAPCTLRSDALGPTPLQLTGLAVDVDVAASDDYAGRLWVGRGANALPVSWRARLDPRGVVVEATGTALPIATLLEAVQPGLPELERARIEGTLSFALRYGGDPSASGTDLASRLQFEPRLEGFVVAGLGTEALLNATPPERCAPATAPLRGWLPVAVLAAEDQAFYSHAGIDLPTVRGAMFTNASTRATVGGSTITQQLAKLVYTGDRRDPVRKLRELLYAVEMERTLGKARILQLYLAIAPWGQGLCGAENAARHYFDKPAARLDPLEAAWLAGLLRNPDAAVHAAGRNGGIDRQRTAWVLAQMRPMASWRRTYWVTRVDRLRPAGALPSEAKPSTNR